MLLTAPLYTPSDFCIVSDNGLFFMLDGIVCLFDPDTSEIIKQKELNTLGSVFQTYRYKDDYILYGEIDIYRITSELDTVWQFSARDIFVRYHGKEPAFEMKEDQICLIDFSDNCYELDYDGNLLADHPLG